MSIQIKQESSYVGDRRWDWSVWLVGSATELDQIDCVTYTLHPTFPNPVQEINTREDGFRLESGGWGEFTIYIDIARKSGKHTQLSHDLKLTSEPTKQAASDTKSVISVIVPATDSVLQEAMPAIKGIAKAFYRRAIEEIADRLPTSTIFVSGGVADAEAVHKLRMALEILNVRILNADDIPSGVPFQVYIESLIGQADLVIFLISGRPSMWMNQEIETAKRHGKHIVPVLVGSGSELPETLKDFHSLHIKNIDSIADLAQGILKL